MPERPNGTVTRLKRRQSVAPQGAFAHTFARIRIGFPQQRQLGPGKIALLEAIGRTGSIAAAGREMGMSYRRAWLLRADFRSQDESTRWQKQSPPWSF